MIVRKTLVQSLIIAITVLAIFAGLIVPKELVDNHILFFSIALILAGVPHGASDYLVFKKLSANFQVKVNAFRFYFAYILLIGIYVITWYYLPIFAFVIFLVISAYHFGQSNWNSVDFDNKIIEYFTNILWGSAIIGVPVLVYFDQASSIILEITNYNIVLNGAERGALLSILIFANLLNINNLFERAIINSKLFRKEIRNFLLLTALFITTPLLVGFGIYFVLWHSVSAVSDQFKIIKSHQNNFAVQEYLAGIIPLSTLAFFGLFGLYFFAGDYYNVNFNLGILFFFISVITVPHAILMDQFYQFDKLFKTKKSIA